MNEDFSAGFFKEAAYHNLLKRTHIGEGMFAGVRNTFARRNAASNIRKLHGNGMSWGEAGELSGKVIHTDNKILDRFKGAPKAEAPVAQVAESKPLVEKALEDNHISPPARSRSDMRPGDDLPRSNITPASSASPSSQKQQQAHIEEAAKTPHGKISPWALAAMGGGGAAAVTGVAAATDMGSKKKKETQNG